MSKAIQTKYCSECKQFKQLDEFNKRSIGKCGRQPVCRICSSALYKTYYQTNEHYKEQKCQYNRSERGKARHKHYRQSKKGKLVHKRYRLKYPDKIKAQRVVNYAVSSYKLPPVKMMHCCFCPKPAKYYHHWQGYEKEHWFDIIPVCVICH